MGVSFCEKWIAMATGFNCVNIARWIYKIKQKSHSVFKWGMACDTFF